MPPPVTTSSSTQPVLNQAQLDYFLSHFEDHTIADPMVRRQRVRAELADIFSKANIGEGALEPKAIAQQLLNRRVADGRMTQADATKLFKMIEQRYAPDAVTGLNNKAATPDVTGLLDLFARTSRPDQHVFMLEGDITNLGKTNDVLGKEKANDLLRLLAQAPPELIREYAQKNNLKVEVIAVRSGGDELRYMVVLEGNITREQAFKDLKEVYDTQIRPAQEEYCAKVGLKDAAHPKAGKLPGVSAAYAIADLKSDVDRGTLLAKMEEVILFNKRVDETMRLLGSKKPDGSYDTTKLDEAIDAHNKTHPNKPIKHADYAVAVKEAGALFEQMTAKGGAWHQSYKASGASSPAEFLEKLKASGAASGAKSNIVGLAATEGLRARMVPSTPNTDFLYKAELAELGLRPGEDPAALRIRAAFLGMGLKDAANATGLVSEAVARKLILDTEHPAYKGATAAEQYLIRQTFETMLLYDAPDPNSRVKTSEFRDLDTALHLAQHNGKSPVIRFSLNNVNGLNGKLGTPFANAMLREVGDVILREELERAAGGKFKDSARRIYNDGGGKFTVLLPDSMTDAERAELTRNIYRRIDELNRMKVSTFCERHGVDPQGLIDPAYSHKTIAEIPYPKQDGVKGIRLDSHATTFTADASVGAQHIVLAQKVDGVSDAANNAIAKGEKTYVGHTADQPGHAASPPANQPGRGAEAGKGTPGNTERTDSPEPGRSGQDPKPGRDQVKQPTAPIDDAEATTRKAAAAEALLKAMGMDTHDRYGAILENGKLTLSLDPAHPDGKRNQKLAAQLMANAVLITEHFGDSVQVKQGANSVEITFLKPGSPADHAVKVGELMDSLLKNDDGSYVKFRPNSIAEGAVATLVFAKAREKVENAYFEKIGEWARAGKIDPSARISPDGTQVTEAGRQEFSKQQVAYLEEAKKLSAEMKKPENERNTAVIENAEARMQALQTEAAKERANALKDYEKQVADHQRATRAGIALNAIGAFRAIEQAVAANRAGSGMSDTAKLIEYSGAATSFVSSVAGGLIDYKNINNMRSVAGARFGVVSSTVSLPFQVRNLYNAIDDAAHGKGTDTHNVLNISANTVGTAGGVIGLVSMTASALKFTRAAAVTGPWGVALAAGGEVLGTGVKIYTVNAELKAFREGLKLGDEVKYEENKGKHTSAYADIPGLPPNYNKEKPYEDYSRLSALTEFFKRNDITDAKTGKRVDLTDAYYTNNEENLRDFLTRFEAEAKAAGLKIRDTAVTAETVRSLGDIKINGTFVGLGSTADKIDGLIQGKSKDKIQQERTSTMSYGDNLVNAAAMASGALNGELPDYGRRLKTRTNTAGKPTVETSKLAEQFPEQTAFLAELKRIQQAIKVRSSQLASLGVDAANEPAVREFDEARAADAKRYKAMDELNSAVISAAKNGKAVDYAALQRALGMNDADFARSLPTLEKIIAQDAKGGTQHLKTLLNEHVYQTGAELNAFVIRKTQQNLVAQAVRIEAMLAEDAPKQKLEDELKLEVRKYHALVHTLHQSSDSPDDAVKAMLKAKEETVMQKLAALQDAQQLTPQQREKQAANLHAALVSDRVQIQMGKPPTDALKVADDMFVGKAEAYFKANLAYVAQVEGLRERKDLRLAGFFTSREEYEMAKHAFAPQLVQQEAQKEYAQAKTDHAKLLKTEGETLRRVAYVDELAKKFGLKPISEMPAQGILGMYGKTHQEALDGITRALNGTKDTKGEREEITILEEQLKALQKTAAERKDAPGREDPRIKDTLARIDLKKNTIASLELTYTQAQVLSVRTLDASLDAYAKRTEQMLLDAQAVMERTQAAFSPGEQQRINEARTLMEEKKKKFDTLEMEQKLAVSEQKPYARIKELDEAKAEYLFARRGLAEQHYAATAAKIAMLEQGGLTKAECKTGVNGAYIILTDARQSPPPGAAILHPNEKDPSYRIAGEWKHDTKGGSTFTVSGVEYMGHDGEWKAASLPLAAPEVPGMPAKPRVFTVAAGKSADVADGLPALFTAVSHAQFTAKMERDKEARWASESYGNWEVGSVKQSGDAHVQVDEGRISYRMPITVPDAGGRNAKLSHYIVVKQLDAADVAKQATTTPTDTMGFVYASCATIPDEAKRGAEIRRLMNLSRGNPEEFQKWAVEQVKKSFAAARNDPAKLAEFLNNVPITSLIPQAYDETRNAMVEKPPIVLTSGMQNIAHLRHMSAKPGLGVGEVQVKLTDGRLLATLSGGTNLGARGFGAHLDMAHLFAALSYNGADVFRYAEPIGGRVAPPTPLPNAGLGVAVGSGADGAGGISSGGIYPGSASSSAGAGTMVTPLPSIPTGQMTLPNGMTGNIYPVQMALPDPMRPGQMSVQHVQMIGNVSANGQFTLLGVMLQGMPPVAVLPLTADLTQWQQQGALMMSRAMNPPPAAAPGNDQELAMRIALKPLQGIEWKGDDALDGKLSDAEKQKFSAILAKSFDKNGNGVLDTPEEKEAARQAFERTEENLRKLGDQNAAQKAIQELRTLADANGITLKNAKVAAVGSIPGAKPAGPAERGRP